MCIFLLLISSGLTLPFATRCPGLKDQIPIKAQCMWAVVQAWELPAGGVFAQQFHTCDGTVDHHVEASPGTFIFGRRGDIFYFPQLMCVGPAEFCLEPNQFT